MKSYVVVKFISKANILFCALLVLVFLGSALVKNSSVGADENQQEEENEDIYGGSVSFQMGGQDNKTVMSITTCSDVFSENALEQKRLLGATDDQGNQENLEPELVKGDGNCYTLKNENSFKSASPQSAIYSFLETSNKISSITNEQKANIKQVWARYGMQIFMQSPDFVITDSPQSGDPNRKIVKLQFKEAIDLIAEKKEIKDEDYVVIEKNGEDVVSLSIVLTDSGYPNAKKDSLWLEINDTIYNLCDDRWAEIGVDFSTQMTLLDRHYDSYTYYTETQSKEVKGSNNVKVSFYSQKVIDLERPKRTSVFKLNIDTSANPTILADPAKAYTKIYIKPSSKESVNKYIMVESATDTTGNALSPSGGFIVGKEFSFNWEHLHNQFNSKIYSISGGVQTSNTLASMPSAEQPYYDPSLPKKYFVHIFVYKTNSSADGNLIGEIETTFEASLLDSSATVVPVVSGSNIFTIVAPRIAQPNSQVPVKFKVDSNSGTVDKVVLYACNEDPTNSDSSGCTLSGGEDAVKGAWVLKDAGMNAFIGALPDTITTGTPPQAVANPAKTKYSNGTFKDLKFLEDINYTWSSAGILPGKTKSLMLKAFTRDTSAGRNEADPFKYINGSKSTASITVPLDGVGAISNSRNRGSTGVGLGLLRTLASDNRFGSSLRGISSAVARLSNLTLVFVGVFAFFAVIVGGFLYMSAQGGDEQKLAKAKKAIIYAIIGIFVAYLAFAIIRVTTSTTTSLRLPSIRSIMEIN